MVGLTPKQKEELNLAIHEYLCKNNYLVAAESLKEEASIDPESQPQSSMADVLEKKWTSLVRLKKQVMELEKQVKHLKES